MLLISWFVFLNKNKFPIDPPARQKPIIFDDLKAFGSSVWFFFPIVENKFQITYFVVSFLLLFFIIRLVFCWAIRSVIVGFFIRDDFRLQNINNNLISTRFSPSWHLAFFCVCIEYLPLRSSIGSVNRSSLNKRAMALYSVVVAKISSMSMVHTPRLHSFDNDAAHG